MYVSQNHNFKGIPRCDDMRYFCNLIFPIIMRGEVFASAVGVKAQVVPLCCQLYGLCFDSFAVSCSAFNRGNLRLNILSCLAPVEYIVFITYAVNCFIFSVFDVA